MLDATGELCLVFNGEIYNFVDLRKELEAKGHWFRSRTDTEVILAAYREWGTDCVTRLNGMFAFALYDAGQRQVFLARDRAGEKPLFYSLANGSLRFASELKALMADPCFSRRVDLEGLDCYLGFGFLSGDCCILQRVKKLPPAHALVFDLERGDAVVSGYWEVPGPPEDYGTGAGEAGLVDELEWLLQDAVRRQLVADVPVGVLLSGGVDSSLVTAMAARASAKVKTFTVQFPGFARYDETEHARLIARHFGTEHIELEAANASPDLLSVLARQFDEPIVDSSMIPTFLVCQVVRRHCTVAVGGDGGDELFGGYTHYPRLLWMARYLGWIPYPLRHVVGRVAAEALPVGFTGRNWLQAMGSDLEQGLPLIASYFDASSRRRLLDGVAIGPSCAERIREQQIPDLPDLLQRATRADFGQYLAEDILVKVDRASMLSSLEVRAPLLDCRVIEFAFGKVPSSLKATATQRKVLLKKLAARVLPPDFDLERKQGFSIPLAAWLRAGPWQRFFREVLLESRDGLFDRRFVAHLFEGQAKGRSNSERLFALVLFELWRREYNVGI
jgi:asparagine synthase (glutamine-hydrolysing)